MSHQNQTTLICQHQNIFMVVPCSFAQLGILSLGPDSSDIQEVLPFGSSEIYLLKELTSANQESSELTTVITIT